MDEQKMWGLPFLGDDSSTPTTFVRNFVQRVKVYAATCDARLDLSIELVMGFVKRRGRQ